MATEQDFEEKQAKVERQRLAQQINALIGNQVIHSLGQPGDLRKVQVKHLWNSNYRVNVFVGVDVASAKVAHSYFLVADSEGKITTSIPAITRHY